MNIEGGNCYIASSQDNFSMVSHSTNYTIRKSPQTSGRGGLDLMFESISSILKNRMLAMVLSGHQLDGDKGMQYVRKNQGYGTVLNAASCLCKELGENILRKSAIDRIVDEQDCIELLMTYTGAQNTES
jgi:chemotaxis response regulator CheB